MPLWKIVLWKFWIWSLIGLTIAFAGYLVAAFALGLLHRLNRYPEFKQRHMAFGRWAWWCIVALVLDVLAGEFPFFREPMTLFNGVHETISVAFFVLFTAIVFRWNGERFPSIHRRLVYPTVFPFGLAVAVTGAIRIYTLIGLGRVHALPFP